MGDPDEDVIYRAAGRPSRGVSPTGLGPRGIEGGGPGKLNQQRGSLRMLVEVQVGRLDVPVTIRQGDTRSGAELLAIAKEAVKNPPLPVEIVSIYAEPREGIAVVSFDSEGDWGAWGTPERDRLRRALEYYLQRG